MKAQFLKHKHKILALGDQAIVSGTNFMVGILITRLAGVESYGRFALYWMIYLFLQGLCNAYIGLPAQVLSSQSENKAAYLEENNRLGKLILVGIIILLYPAFYIYDLIADAAFGYGYWLFPLVIVCFLKHEMNRKYFYARMATEKVVIIDLCTYFLQLPALLVLSFGSAINLNSILLVFISFGTLGQLMFLIIKDRPTTNFNLKNLPWKTNWNYGKHLISTTILQWFSGNILLISAGSIIGIGAVGIIRVMQNIMGVLHILFLTLENVVPVKAAMLLNNHSKKHMLTYFKKVALVTGIVYGIVLLALSIFGNQILGFLYGPDYAGYDYLLDLFIWLYVLIFIGTIAQLMIKTLRKNQGIFIAYVLSVFAAFLIANPLLKTFEMEGIVMGLGILQCITLSVYFFTLKRALS